MTIKFVCRCGKQLSAHDEMAGRRSMCPQCRQPVGIPLLNPTHRGVNSGKIESPKRSTTKQRGNSQTTKPIGDPSIKQPVVTSASDRTRSRFNGVTPDQIKVVRKSKKFYSISNWRPSSDPTVPFIPIILGGVLAIAMIVASLSLPSAMQASTVRDRNVQALWFAATGGLFCLIGYFLAYQHRVLRAATEGKTDWVAWPNWSFDEIMRSTKWFARRFFGPAVCCAIGLWYWINCGEFTFLDAVILAELVIPAIAYLLIDLPRSVAPTHRLVASQSDFVSILFNSKRQWYLATLFATLMLFGHAFFGFLALEQLHSEAVLGSLCVAIVCVSASVTTTMILRYCGGLYFRILKDSPGVSSKQLHTSIKTCRT